MTRGSRNSATLLCIVLAMCPWSGSKGSGISARQELITSLLSWYQQSGSKFAIPEPDDGGPLQVTVNLEPSRVISIEKDVVTFLAWLPIEWRDPRLSWEGKQGAAGNIKRIVLPADQIWLPDLELYSGIEKQVDLVEQNNVIVYRNGSIVRGLFRQMTSPCHQQPTTLPRTDFTYACDVKLASWLYPGTDLEISPKAKAVDLSMVEAADWMVLNATVKKNVMVYECCPEPYVDVTYTLLVGHNAGKW